MAETALRLWPLRKEGREATPKALHLNADFDPGWPADASSRHGVPQIGIVGEGVSFFNRGEPVKPRDLVRIIGIPKDGGIRDAVPVPYRLRLVVFDPPGVKILHRVLHDHQNSCHLTLLAVFSDYARYARSLKQAAGFD